MCYDKARGDRMDLKKTGNLISSARREKRITQKELAEKLHVSDRTVSKWERGAGFPDVSILTELADILGLTVTELLQGEHVNHSDSDTEAELTIREAVNVVYQQTAATAKKNRMRLLSAVLFLALIVGGVGFGVKKLEEKRILFPPEIISETLQDHNEVEFSAELLVDKASRGVYNYNCRYEIDQYGNVKLAERNVWESFSDTVSSDVYKSLKELCPGELTTIWSFDSGWLAEYHRFDTSKVCLIETDVACEPVFSCEYDSSKFTSPCLTAFLSDGKVHAVAYNGLEQRMYVISVDKNDGSIQQSSFTYGELSGRGSEETNKIGGFMFEGQHMWVKDDVLYFAEAHYSGNTMSVVASYDLKEEKPLVFREMEGSHVTFVKKDLENDRVYMVVNPMNYQPLQMIEMDAWTLEVLNVTELELPHEYMSRIGHDDYGSYLFEVDMSDHQILIKYPDVFSETRLREQEERTEILALYDRETGDMIWRARLILDVNYNIYDVHILE
jgi:transcriptional regulator with XRE-family HTH domain